jgi:hypothetical protein
VSRLALQRESVRDRMRAAMMCTQRSLCEYEVEQLVRAGLVSYTEIDPVWRLFPMTGMFLVVPPQPQPLDVVDAMARVELKGVQGQCYGTGQYDIRRPERRLTILSHVEDGSGLLGTSAVGAEAFIRAERRSGFSTWQGIIYAVVFPWMFETHGVYILGSRHCDRCTLGLINNAGTIALTQLSGCADGTIGAVSYGDAIKV